MNALIMAAVLAAAPADQATKTADAAAPHMEGKWLVVYAEENGHRVQGWEQSVANLKDGALTYDRDGKETTINLKFGDDQTLQVSEGDSAAKGVYIAGQDYLCISLAGGHFAGKAKAKEETSKEKDAKADEPTKKHFGGSFILILRRQR